MVGVIARHGCYVGEHPFKRFALLLFRPRLALGPGSTAGLGHRGVSAAGA